MKRLMGLMVAVAVLGTAVSAPAGERVKQTGFNGPALFAPSFALGQGAPPAPAGEAAMQPVPAAEAPAVELFHCVQVKDPDHVAPCAVPCIVMIADPCPSTCCDPCGCCAPPKCVAVQICVPPCGCPEIKRSKDGHKVKYDYGKYEVELKSKDGVVYVDYDN